MFCWYWRKYAFRVWYSEYFVAEQSNANTRPLPPRNNKNNK